MGKLCGETGIDVERPIYEMEGERISGKWQSGGMYYKSNQFLAAFDLLEPETKELILTNLGEQLGLTPEQFKNAVKEKVEEMLRKKKVGFDNTEAERG